MFQLKWVWQNMEGLKGRYIFALCCTIVLSACDLMNSIITSFIMDTVFSPIEQGAAINEALIRQLVFLVVTLVLFTLFRTSTNYEIGRAHV